MFKGLGNIASLIKEAQNLGPKMQAVSEELKAKRVSASAGGEMVTVHANGLGEILSIEVDPLLQEKGDVEMVADLLPAAINQAVAKSRALHVEAMQSITGGLPLPGGLADLMGGLGTLDDDLSPPTPPSPPLAGQ